MKAVRQNGDRIIAACCATGPVSINRGNGE